MGRSGDDVDVAACLAAVVEALHRAGYGPARDVVGATVELLGRGVDVPVVFDGIVAAMAGQLTDGQLREVVAVLLALAGRLDDGEHVAPADVATVELLRGLAWLAADVLDARDTERGARVASVEEALEGARREALEAAQRQAIAAGAGGPT